VASVLGASSTMARYKILEKKYHLLKEKREKLEEREDWQSF
jgi:hypothetical protein